MSYVAETQEKDCLGCIDLFPRIETTHVSNRLLFS